MRYILLIVITLVAITLTGCTALSSENINETFKNYWHSSDVELENVSEDLIDDEIEYVPVEQVGFRIGSWNLEIFGQAKVDNEPVIEGMRQVMNDYDILAVQEVRDRYETAFLEFMADQLPQYDYVVSERLGRTNSKEQYAFIWSSRVQKIGDGLVYPDEHEWFERPPYTMEFRVANKSLVFLNTHIKPTEAEQEIPHLIDVVQWAEDEYHNPNIVLVGDYNQDCVYYFGDGLPYYEISDDSWDTTTTRTDCTYDRMYSTMKLDIIDSGVDDYEDDGISEELAEAISDHWSIFMVIQ